MDDCLAGSMLALAVRCRADAGRSLMTVSGPLRVGVAFINSIAAFISRYFCVSTRGSRFKGKVKCFVIAIVVCT